MGIYHFYRHLDMLSHIPLNVYVQQPESTNRLKHGGLQNATVTKHSNPVAGGAPIEDPGGRAEES